MWRNHETQGFVEWLRSHNKNLGKEKMAEFYNLDLFSTTSSIQAILNYLDQYDAKMGIEARERYRSLEPWIDNPLEHSLGSLSDAFRNSEANILQMLQGILDKRLSVAKVMKMVKSFTTSKRMRVRLQISMILSKIAHV